MSRGTAIVLLGLGVGALIVGSSSRESADGIDALRQRAVEAQQRAARAAREARELTARWSALTTK